MKCYFCGKDCLSDSDAVLSINCKTLMQSELFRANVCHSCTDAVMGALALLKHVTRNKEDNYNE